MTEVHHGDFPQAVFRDGHGEIIGEASLDSIIEAAGKHKFKVSVYRIDNDKIYFWANMPGAEVLHNDLSTEFTDLQGLINKMVAENLTGVIEVSIGQGEEGGFMFFQDGKIIGGSYSWTESSNLSSERSHDSLIGKTKALGGLCNVRRISQSAQPVPRAPDKAEAEAPLAVLTFLEELLGTFEQVLTSNKKVKTDFDTLLKKKFLEKVDKYPFLDPFAAELTYSNRKLSYAGSASDKELARGLVESIMELAGQMGTMPQLKETLGPWSEKYAREIAGLGISL
ncbi:MAG: hypothetical protein P8175_05760 [Deltaproteobacteria bacterium]